MPRPVQYCIHVFLLRIWGLRASDQSKFIPHHREWMHGFAIGFVPGVDGDNLPIGISVILMVLQ